MSLKQTLKLKPTLRYKMVLRNFFMMTTTVILLFSLGLVLLINTAKNDNSYASKGESYFVVNVKGKK